jgi:hypothetical protein
VAAVVEGQVGAPGEEGRLEQGQALGAAHERPAVAALAGGGAQQAEDLHVLLAHEGGRLEQGLLVVAPFAGVAGELAVGAEAGLEQAELDVVAGPGAAQVEDRLLGGAGLARGVGLGDALLQALGPGEDLGAGLLDQRAGPPGGQDQRRGVLAAVAHRAGAAGEELEVALAEELAPLDAHGDPVGRGSLPCTRACSWLPLTSMWRTRPT